MTRELAVEVEEPASKAYENKVANKINLMIPPRQVILSPNQKLKKTDKCKFNDESGMYSKYVQLKCNSINCFELWAVNQQCIKS